MWKNIKYEKPKNETHVHVWLDGEIKLMFWNGSEFLPPKYEWHEGVDGLFSCGYFIVEYEMWFDIEEPTAMDIIECQSNVQAH